MKISIDPNWTPGKFRLVVTSHGSSQPAGPRLLKSPPHPNVSFLHDDLKTAQEHAARLQIYCDGLEKTRNKKKSTATGAWQD